MITSFLSTQSRKAWVAGVLAAFVQPVLNLLSGSDVLTIRTLVVAILSGVVAAVAVWATDNAEQESTPTTAPAAVAAAPATDAQAVPPVDVENGTDFQGQSVTSD